MSGDFCGGPDPVVNRSNSANALVNDAFNTFYSIAVGGVSESQIDDYGEFFNGWVPTNLTPWAEVGIPAFSISVPAPDQVNIVYQQPLFTATPPTTNVDIPSFVSAPKANISTPTLYTPAPPENLTEAAPAYDVVTDTVTIPDEPTLNLPTPPTLEGITLPTAEELNLPTFDAVKPTLKLSPLTQGLEYVEPEYVSAVKDAVEAKILDIFNMGIALPAYYWQQIVDRTNSDQIQATQRAVDTATAEWGLMGWDRPSGPLNRAIREAREAGEGEESKTRRDIFIKRTDLETDNVKFAVVQGLAWDEQNLRLFNAVQDRALQVAKERILAEKLLLDSRVEIFNAEKDFWVAEAQVHQQLIQAELLKLEKFKGEIEAQALVGQINEQSVKIYVAQVEAATKVVEVFKAQVDAARAVSDNNRAKIQAWAERVRAYEAVVSAWSKEWDGYVSANEANRLKVQLFAEEWDAFGTRINAYQAENEARKIEPDLQIRKGELDVRVFAAQVEKHLADIQGARAELEALASQARSNADYTRSLTDLERVKVSALQGQTNSFIEQARAKASVDTANAQIAAEEVRSQRELAFKAMDSKIRALEQRIASALSGISYGASLTDSTQWQFGTNWRYGCDTSYTVSAQA